MFQFLKEGVQIVEGWVVGFQQRHKPRSRRPNQVRANKPNTFGVTVVAVWLEHESESALANKVSELMSASFEVVWGSHFNFRVLIPLRWLLLRWWLLIGVLGCLE